MFYEDFYNSEEEVLPENEPKKGFFFSFDYSTLFIFLKTIKIIIKILGHQFCSHLKTNLLRYILFRLNLLLLLM